MNKEQFIQLLQSLEVDEIKKIDFQFTTFKTGDEVKQIYYESNV